MSRRLLSIIALLGALVFSAAGAANAAVVGSVAGPGNSPNLIVSFENTGPEDILQISFDSSATATPFIWTNAFVDPAIAPVISGTGTSSLLFTWDPGEFITDDVFGALLLTQPSVFVSSLVGVIVRVVFEDDSVFVGQFVSNTGGSGLVLSAVPLPTALPLLASGLIGLVFLARSRNRRQPEMA